MRLDLSQGEISQMVKERLKAWKDEAHEIESE
jgi:hypothetical protein